MAAECLISHLNGFNSWFPALKSILLFFSVQTEVHFADCMFACQQNCSFSRRSNSAECPYSFLTGTTSNRQKVKAICNCLDPAFFETTGRGLLFHFKVTRFMTSGNAFLIICLCRFLSHPAHKSLWSLKKGFSSLKKPFG